MVSFRLAGVLAVAMMLVGCTVPLTPNDVRQMAKDGQANVEKFEVPRPYTAVTHDIKAQSDKCLERVYKVDRLYEKGFIFKETVRETTGYILYKPVSKISGTRAEFYTKKAFVKVKEEGDKEDPKPEDKMVFYVADVTPKGNGTALTVYYFDWDMYRWGLDAIKAWAKGESGNGCPIIPNP